MNFLKSIIFGIIEGITEWMPVSSTAHMMVLNKILSLDVSSEFYGVFEVVIQLGAIVAALIVFFKKIWPFGESKYPLGKGILKYVKKNKFLLCLKLLVTCIPVIIFELFLDDYVKLVNENNEMTIISLALIVVGCIFIVVELFIKNKLPVIETTKDITFIYALYIGLAQLVAAIIPGVSRSGACIICALLLGFSRICAVEFIFELSIPTMIGASFMKMLKYGFAFTFSEIIILLIGCVVAFIVSLFMINFVLNYIKKNTFTLFGIYRIAMGILVFLFLR